MLADDYQREAHKTSCYGVAVMESGKTMVDWLYPALGLSEEAGEVAGKFAKAVRDCNGVIDEERQQAIIKELGDVLWFVAEIALLMNTPLSEVMEKNLAKLKSRAERGVIHGSGDNR